MIDIYRKSTFWGILFIIGGSALLIQNFTGFPIGGYFWGALFLLSGGVCLALYFKEQSIWWLIIPGISLFGFGLSFLFSSIIPVISVYQNTLFLGSIALSFYLVFFKNKRLWWSILPAGVLFSLCALSLLSVLNISISRESIFLIGVGITFLFLFFVSKNERIGHFILESLLSPLAQSLDWL